VVALTPALAYFQAAHTSPATAATLSYVTLALTLLGRPVGAFIFGPPRGYHRSAPSTLISVAGAGGATLQIGLLPGTRWIGWAAMVLVFVLRFIGACSWAASTPRQPAGHGSDSRRLRGLVGG